MLTHAQLWTALDRLAARAGLSPSGLAKAAGLDPTSFNKSKRITPQGRERWPSTESVAKALAATNTSMDAFVQLIGESGHTTSQALPLIGFAQMGNPAENSGAFDDAGIPVGNGWDETAFPGVDDENAYAMGGVAGHAGLSERTCELFLFSSDSDSCRQRIGQRFGGPNSNRIPRHRSA